MNQPDGPPGDTRGARLCVASSSCPPLRRSDSSSSRNSFAVARGSPARNMQHVLIRGKEIAAVSTTVTAINREKGILDACARANVAPESRRYFGKLRIATNRD